MPTPVILGEFEQLVLLVTLRLGDNCHALSMRKELARIAGRPVSRGALYRTLDRLGDKGLLAWSVEEQAPSRGGLPRRQFRVTRRGVADLKAARRTLLRLWDGLEEVFG